MALLCVSCFGAKAELRRRGIPADEEQLVAHSAGGEEEVVHLLLRAEVPVDGRDSYGTTALLAACDSGRTGVVRLLLEQGADADLGPEGGGAAPLALAAMRGHQEIAQLLLAAGAPVENLAGPRGMVPLIMAAAEGHERIVADLLDAGADVQSRDATGWTALHHAVRGGRAAVVHRLLEAGADPKLEDGDGWSSLELSKSRGDWELVAVLEEQIEDQRRRRASRVLGAPLAIPPGWSVADRFDARSAYWPEHAAFSTSQDPPGSRRILLRSPRSDEAQIFLILGRAGPWWNHYRDTVQRIENDPGLEARHIQRLTSKDGLELELRRYRLGQGGRSQQGTERVMALGEARGAWVLIIDAGGSPAASGVERIEAVLRQSRLLEAVGAEKLS